MATDILHTIDEDTGLQWSEYRFANNGKANMVIVRGVDGLVVISPGAGLDARVLDAVAEQGPVRALVANNSWHHLGQPAWRQRFPDAVSYAPTAALAGLRQKHKTIPWQPLSSLTLPGHVHAREVPGVSIGETLFTVETKRGPVFFAGDLLANITTLPPPPMKWAFTLSGSGPGFRLFKLATTFIVKNKDAAREEALAAIDALPPSVVVPAHGRPVDSADVAERARTELLRL